MVIVVGQRPQPGAVQVAREDDFTTAAARHGRRIAVQGQAALLLILVVTGEAVFTQDGFDVVVIRDLRTRRLGVFGLRQWDPGGRHHGAQPHQQNSDKPVNGNSPTGDAIGIHGQAP